MKVYQFLVYSIVLVWSLNCVAKFLGGSYLERIVSRSSWFIVSKALTRCVNNIHEGKLWIFLVCSIVFSVKDSSRQPTPGVEPD